MKKKLMMVAVLFGALSLGACVDDNESQSVTDVRNAKAEQLKAVAAMYNAEAEAKLITANAEKALAEAQAAYEQARAEAELANAEHQKELTEQAKQRFAVEIERIKAEAERAIAYAKLEAARNEQALLDLADEHLRELYEKYRSALGNITYYQNRKIYLTTQISQAEAGLVPLQTQVDYQVAYWQKMIDMEEYKITLYNEYEGADLVELEKAEQKAYKEYDIALDAEHKARAAYEEASDAYYMEVDRFYLGNNVTNPIKTVAAADELNKNGWYWVLTITNKELSDLDYTDIPYYTLNASNVESEKQSLENDVKRKSEHLGTDKDDATKSTLYGWLANAKKQKADALAANPNADVTSYDNTIKQWEAEIVTAKEELKKAEERLAKFNSLIPSFAGDDLKAYDAAVAELTKLAKAWEKVYAPFLDAVTAREKAWNKYEAARELASQTDVEQLIADCKNNIAEYQGYQLNWKNDVTNQETAIAQYKSELETIDGQIAAQQAIIDNLKKLIDAAIAEQK